MCNKVSKTPQNPPLFAKAVKLCPHVDQSFPSKPRIRRLEKLSQALVQNLIKPDKLRQGFKNSPNLPPVSHAQETLLIQGAKFGGKLNWAPEEEPRKILETLAEPENGKRW